MTSDETVEILGRHPARQALADDRRDPDQESLGF
jgi:hypothetical protein